MLVTWWCLSVDCVVFFFFSSRRRHTRCSRDWSSDVCSSDLVGACAALTLDKQGVCSKAGVGVTGAGTRAVRAKGVEAALVGKRLDAATIEAAAQKAADGVDVQADLQGSVEYKSHLCRVFAKRAITEAVRRAGA